MKHLSQRKGELAEAKCLFDCRVMDWLVSLPGSVALPYDIAILRSLDIGWEKVQIKFVGYHKASNKRRVSIRKRRYSAAGVSNKYVYKEGDFDLLYLYCPANNNSWLIPYGAVKDMSAITPNKNKWDKYKLSIDKGLEDFLDDNER